jgi:uncharacterized protein
LPFVPLPRAAAWQHVGVDARAGFETVFFSTVARGTTVRGATSAVADGVPWIVRYRLEIDERWCTRVASVVVETPDATRETELQSAGNGRWSVDGVPRPELEGCFDVDLESSACTNTAPVHRLDLAIGARAHTPAVYVRAADGAVERLEQEYRRVPGEPPAFDYASPAFSYADRLAYDAAGLVVDYPGIAHRVL